MPDGLPHCLRLGLNASDSIHHQHGPIQNGHTPMNFDRKVNVARCVNDCDGDGRIRGGFGGGFGGGSAALSSVPNFPRKRNGCTLDGNASFPFGIEVIGNGVTIIHAPRPSNHTCQS